MFYDMNNNIDTKPFQAHSLVIMVTAFPEGVFKKFGGKKLSHASLHHVQ